MSKQGVLQRKAATPSSTTARAPSTAAPVEQGSPGAVASPEPASGFDGLERAAGLGHRLEQIPTHVPAAPGKAGQPLPAPVREKMEASFGHDFSKVRVHQDGNAEALGATAYTRGQDVHFAPGHYQPRTAEGQALIGHELTHVVQQRAGNVAVPQGKGAPINANPSLEAEADAQGARASRGEPAVVRGVGGGVQRKAQTGGGGVIQCQGGLNEKGKKAPTGKKKPELGLAKKQQHHDRPEYAAQTSLQSQYIMKGMSRKDAKRQAKADLKEDK